MGWVLTLCVLLAVRATTSYLLPKDLLTPHAYTVRYVFDIDPKTNFSFFGIVDIELKAWCSTSKIVLHAQDFKIAEEAIRITGRNAPKVTEAKLNDTFNFLTLQLSKPLEVANYTLTIPFYGNLKTGLDGAYISTFTDSVTKVKEYLISTQFEAISARKAFPCFDEPKYKATFQITIGRHENFTAISNMPVANSSHENALEEIWPSEEISRTFHKDLSSFIWDQFETSVPMSTYLVAFMVSKFGYQESPAELSNTKFKIWARKDALDQTIYASQVGPKVLSYFEKFFNISYPLPKMDMAAIPDFSAGAMENWGLITYRENSLLYDKEQSSFMNKERVAEVIAHELAHQWFGNLVTMKWWSDLWLNEGFATYVATLGVHAVEPAWESRINAAVDSLMLVLNLDALETSHPVSVTLDDPKRISEIFDEISYRKGAVLIRMMALFLGEDVFQKALHKYLVKHSYHNAAQDDLWSALTEVSRQYGGLTRNVTVKEVMDTWTTQTGYPLLTVIRDYSDNSVTVTQKRYLNEGAKASTAVSWWIPLSVMCESEVGQEPDPVEWLASDEGVKGQHRFEHGASAKEWILFNPDMIAPYRVNYDKRNWKLLGDSLSGDKFTNIPLLGRVQILSDAFALAWNDQLDYSTALTIANYLQQETEYLPLSTGLKALSKIENVLKRSSDYGAFQKFVRKLITQQYEQAGGLAKKRIINEDNLNSVRMQLLTSVWACRMQVPSCAENALELFRSWMDMEKPDEYNPIPLDLRKTVYCVAIKQGGVREWRFALTRLQRSNVASARDALHHALSCTREVWILTQYLEWAVNDTTVVRRQDATRVLTDVASSTVGYYVAKDFIYTRIADIYNAFSGQSRKMGFIMKVLLQQFTTQRELDEFLAWHEQNKKYLEDGKLAVSQAIEGARVNIGWLSRNRRAVVDKLREYSSQPEETRSVRASVPSWRFPNFMHSIYSIHNLTSDMYSPHKRPFGFNIWK